VLGHQIIIAASASLGGIIQAAAQATIPTIAIPKNLRFITILSS
jgi:hypothetical protein